MHCALLAVQRAHGWSPSHRRLRDLQRSHARLTLRRFALGPSAVERRGEMSVCIVWRCDDGGDEQLAELFNEANSAV